MGQLQIGERGSKRAHFRFTSTLATVALMSPVARSLSLQDSVRCDGKADARPCLNELLLA